MDRGVWQATVLGVIKICTRLKQLSMHTHTQSLSILYSCCHCWCCKIDTAVESETLGTEKRKTEKKKNENLLSLNAKNSLSHSWSRTTWCLLELSAQVCGCQRKSGNSTADLVVLLRLGLLSQSVHYLLQSPQVSEPLILYGFHSCIRHETQGSGDNFINLA